MKLKGKFLKKDGQKEIIHWQKLMGVIAGFLLVALVISFVQRGCQDTSFFHKTDKRLTPATAETPTAAQTSSPGTNAIRDMGNQHQAVSKNNRGSGSLKLNYKAQQVIARNDVEDDERTIAVGTNFLGKVLSPIDSREPEALVKVLLPYGAKGKTQAEIPKNSTLFGTANYPGKGEKIYMRFTKILTPEGKEFEIEASALSPVDYTPGIAADYHGNTDTRVATALGLTMVGGMTDVMTEKEALGPSASGVVAKPTLKNAFYNGVSEVAKAEAAREADSLSQAQDYVTVPAGTDLIVSLTKSYVQY